MNGKKKSKLFRRWTVFIGQAAFNGATEEELNILVKASDLIPKYEGWENLKRSISRQKGGDKV